MGARERARLIGRVIAIGLALAGLAACEPAPAAPELDGGVVSKDGISTQSTSLIDHEAWVFSEVDEDPFPHHRPEAFSCESWSYRVEDDAFEVDTGTCDYITVVQPTRVDLAKGDLIEAALWHQTLLGEWGVAETTPVVAVRFQVPVDGDWWGVVRHSLTGFGLFYSDSGILFDRSRGGYFNVLSIEK